MTQKKGFHEIVKPLAVTVVRPVGFEPTTLDS